MVAKMNEGAKAVSRPKPLVGTVVSDKMDKTVVVKVARSLKHPLYEKVIRRHKKFKVHDEGNQAREGDIIEITECRPMSKDKHMTLVRILEKY